MRLGCGYAGGGEGFLFYALPSSGKSLPVMATQHLEPFSARERPVCRGEAGGVVGSR